MANLLNETRFEEHIAKMLAFGVLYNERQSENFDLESLCDMEMLDRFLRAQKQTWAKLERLFPGQETATVVAEYNKLINRGESILRLLQKGITIKGAKVKFVQYKPVLESQDSDAWKLYEENRFSVVRQMRYSNSLAPYGSSSNESRNRLDLCILINGLPLLTCELKNEGSGQNYNNGIYQYCYERNPENRLLRNCLVHFVMDNNFVFMTTKLNGAETRFLPFNRESTNPPVEGDYPTSYMWRVVDNDEDASKILGANSLLDIIENFIKRYQDEKNQPVVVFPRFHQLRAVRKMRSLVRAQGPGHNYLIQHSAGSGKTKSMAWLAHQLANMANADKTPVFDSIIMVTDRIVLNRNMADDVVNFETVAGTVKDIRRGSKNLASALNDGYRIIISTVQKFAYALKDLKREQQRTYAVIIDEAHTAIGNESAKDLMNALSTDEDLKKIEGFDPADFDSEMDALMAYMQVMRRQMSHISHFAFTATPKDKTYALYGVNGKAHDLYSMKQAIDEKFILDVLQNYKSYHTMFEYIEKNPDEDQDKLFEEKKALRVIYGELNKNAYIKLRKANMILEHFMKHTINKIGRQAKAMVVTDSRQAAADYKQLLDRLIADQYDGKIKTLVAFSGEVNDSHGRKCSEYSMNDDHVKDDEIRQKFMEDDYKILVVAEKFQTGFDQPLLHTMYVDRSLGGIQCIQTLSRLNRCYPGKEDTMVIDFRNDVDNIQKAFQQYYTETTLEGEVDTQKLYTLKDDIDKWNVFNEEEINKVVTALLDPKKVIEVPSMLKRIVDERVAPLKDEDKDLYRKLVNRYVRQYGFIAQLLDYVDGDLEKYYIFCKVFYKYLPYTKETLPMELLERIDLNKLRIQMAFEGQLELEDEEQSLKSSRIGSPGRKQEEEKLNIKEILHLVNSPYEQFLDENDKILKAIWDEILVDPDVVDAFNANNTWDILLNIVKDKFDEKIALQIEKYYNFAEVLEKEKSLSLTLMKRFVEALAERTGKAATLIYDEEALKECMMDALKQVLSDVCSHVRSLEEFVDELFFVLNQVSLPTLDGVNELIKNNLNNIYTNDQIRYVDKLQCFNSLVSKFEAYLKKLYYLIHSEEVEGKEGKTATLANAIHSFDCLWNLKDGTSEEAKKYADYLQKVRDWRNEMAHTAPTPSEQEIDEDIQIVVAMYLYVTGNSITDLEIAGYTAEYYPMAAELLEEPTPDE